MPRDQPSWARSFTSAYVNLENSMNKKKNPNQHEVNSDEKKEYGCTVWLHAGFVMKWRIYCLLEGTLPGSYVSKYIVHLRHVNLWT